MSTYESTNSTVYLVGAGPGDPELISVKGHKLLQCADAIVYDRLIDKSLLDLSKKGCEMVDVGKSPGGNIDQDQINKLLVELSSRHKSVVRLKGGDPFIFGRGGEEVLELIKHGINYEVVPGITSATSGPLLAGIPLTHRGISAGFVVITGSTVETEEINYKALVELNSTIVILMGVTNRDVIKSSLIENGMSKDTPIALIRWASYDKQEVTRILLSQLSQVDLKPPAIIVVGKVAELDFLL